jgi:hypothetical protein
VAGCILVIASLDILTTVYIIGNGGFEANTLMAPVVGSLPLFLTVKYTVCWAIFGMALYADRLVHNSSNVIFSVVFLVSCLPVISNTLVIARVIP